MSPPSFPKIRIFKHRVIKLRSGDSPRSRLLTLMFKVTSADGAAQFLYVLVFEGPVILSYGRRRSPVLVLLSFIFIFWRWFGPLFIIIGV